MYNKMNKNLIVEYLDLDILYTNNKICRNLYLKALFQKSQIQAINNKAKKLLQDFIIKCQNVMQNLDQDILVII